MTLKLKRMHITGVIVAITSILALGFPLPASAASDATTVGSLTLVPTFECISVYSDFEEDDNQNNSVVMEYRQQGSGTWITGHPLVVDRRTTLENIQLTSRTDPITIANPFNYQWRGSIVGLSPNVTYEVRVIYTDPDGVIGTNPVQGSITTLNENIPLGNGNSYYVATTGSDETGNGTLANPWQTIQHAANNVSAGDTVFIRGGIYSTSIVIAASGNPVNGYITFTNYGGENALVTNSDDAYNVIDAVNNWDFVGTANGHSIYRTSHSGVGSTGFWYLRPSDGEPVRLWEYGGLAALEADANAVSGAYTSDGGYLYCYLPDGSDPDTRAIYLAAPGNTFDIRGSYICIKGLEIGFSRDSDIYADGTYHHILIDGCTIHGTLEFEGSGGDALGNPNGPSDIIIRNNKIYEHTTYRHLTRIIRPGATTAIQLRDTAGHFIIYRNIIAGDGRFKDGIGGEDNDDIYDGLCRDSDVYENYISDCWSDTLEAEGGQMNIRMWGNVVKQGVGGMAFAHAAISIGPVYDFRNTIHTVRDSAWKLGGARSYSPGEGYLFIYHNTIYSPYNSPLDTDNYRDEHGNGISGFGNTRWYKNLWTRNNIIHVDRWLLERVMPIMPDGSPGNHSLDYDNLYTENPGAGSDHFSLTYGYDSYGSLSDFQSATGQEMHGLNTHSQFVDPANNDLRLQPTSPCIDSGVIIPGFNDVNSAWSYSGNAPDIGAFEYGSGGPSNWPPLLNTIGNKSVNVGEPLVFTVSGTDPNGDPLTFSASNLPDGASFNTGTGEFSWTPQLDDAGTYANVHFEVSDGTLTDYEYITITVLSGDENGAPLLNTIGNKSVTEGNPLQFTISATDPDGDPLTFSADNLPMGATFNPTTRTFSWTPIAGQAGTYPNVHFEVSDGELTDSENITITVSVLPVQPSLPLRVNAAGNQYIDSQSNTWAADQAYVSGSWGFYGTDNTIDRGTGHAISGTVDDRIYQTERYGLSGYRFDLENGTYDIILHFAETYSGITGPGQRVFDVSIEGQLVLDNLDVYSEAGYSTALKKVFNSVAVQDGQLNIDFANYIEQPEINGIEILLAGGNHAPVLNPIGNKSITEEELLEFAVTATDPNNDALTFSADNLPEGASFDTETGTFSWTPTTGQADIYPDVYFEVSDSELTDSESITITVLSADNSAPVLDAIGNKPVREDELLEFVIYATDPDDDILTFSASNLPQGAIFNPITRTFSWTPSLGQRGSYSYIRFGVTDGVLSDTEYITITVTKNDPPVLDTIGNKSVREDETLVFTISATDADDDPLTFSADNLPDGASFDVETGEFSWTPNSTQIGSYENVHFEVSDGTFTDSEDITVTVLSIGNNAPVLGTIDNQSVNETEPLEFTVSATDPDDDPLIFSADNLPDGASFDTETGVFSWTPALGQADTYPAVHFEVSDGELTDSEDITITVNIPTPPGGGGGGDVGEDNPGGGGGGDVGGDSEASSEEPEEPDEPDETPPVIQEVEIYDVGTDSAVIRWTTTEPGTSQVEYWASPSQFSPLDETLVTEHVVYLTGLNPGTAYNYRTLSQDETGNLATSSAYDFTTPGEPAAFTVSWLTISPAEANIGQEVTISALITNTGDATGSHDVILSIDGVVQATESIIDLAGGASQEVVFNIARETAGVYTVNVNGTTGIIVVSGAGESELAISLFGITPHYESDTGVITFTRVDYGINESYYSALFSQFDTELILKAGLGDEPLEEVTLIASGQSEPDMSTGSLDYIPAGGWTSSTYSFQVELRTGEGVIEISPPVRLIITPAAAAGVASWATLGEIIGGVLIIALLAVLLILHRNRDMLRTQSLE